MVAIKPYAGHNLDAIPIRHRCRFYLSARFPEKLVLLLQSSMNYRPSWCNGFQYIIWTTMKLLAFHNVWPIHCQFRFLISTSRGYLASKRYKLLDILNLLPINENRKSEMTSRTGNLGFIDIYCQRGFVCLLLQVQSHFVQFHDWWWVKVLIVVKDRNIIDNLCFYVNKSSPTVCMQYRQVHMWNPTFSYLMTRKPH